FHALDISDPMQIRLISSAPMGGRGGYLTIQDHFAHVGASSHYVKIDLSDEREFRLAGTASSGLVERDEDFAVALGNLVILSDDHYNGSFIFAHQAEPDTTGPQVNMVVPADGAGHQSRASRIGLTFTDRIDLRTVNAETLIVRPIGREEALPGRYSSQTGIVNFAPDHPLEPDTTYEIIVPAGGIRDVAGNGTPVAFRSTFSTGDANGAAFWCAIEPPAPVETGQTATFQARVLEGPPGLRFRWSFGDGRDSGEPSSSSSAGHTYTQPGHYTVRVQVTDGRRATGCSTLATVYNRPLPGIAPASSTIILDQSGTQVWNVNPDHNSVTATDAVNLTKMFEAPVGLQPRTLAQAPDGSMWVVNQGDATISVLSNGTGGLLATIPLPPGSEPYGILFHPRQPTAYVSLQATGQIARLDAAARAVTGLLATGPTPRGLAMTADGQRLLVTRFISPDTHGEVVEVDPAAFAVRRTLTLPFDPGPDTESSGRGVPNGLSAALVAPDGARLWVASRKHNIARGQQRDGQRLTFESTVRSMIAQIDLATGQELLSERHDFNNRDGPVAARFSPLGDYLFVVLEGSNAIEVLDAYSGQMITSIEGVGAAPQGLVFTSDGSKLFVHSWLTRSLLVYDVANILKPAARSARLLGEISTVDKELLPAEVLAGKRLFYNAEDPRMDRDEYMACASCHFDSRDDGRVWDRTAEGEGLRNTISLLGRGSPAHGRLHWSANFDEVQDFEHDIRAAFGGSGFLSDEMLAQGSRAHPLGDPKAGLSAELDALTAYVASLRTLPASPYRTVGGALTEAGVKGKAIFHEAGCAGCHGGPEFTDSPNGLLHDVGTLSAASGGRLGGPLAGLDTPSLRGLWLTPPYLHDGSAPTLMDVFTTRNADGRHGALAEALAADPQALDNLVAYLLQIDGREPGPPMPSPAVELVSPADGARFAPGEPILLAVNTAPALGPAARVEFRANNALIGEDPDVLYTLTWTGAAPGDYELTARLVYANGASTTSRPITVHVAP
ncbi:MAG TPA: Ig-like domain-containing protein, partial [Caldilineaceae bacterium]|nr:Ig-like domain-containing protein [Caldilineaceae bacterium]